MTAPSTFMDTQRALTFSIGDTFYGIDVKNILAFTDAFGEIRSGSDSVPGFLGYLDYRETLVKVFECATVLNRQKERDGTNALIEEIIGYKAAHLEWVSELERALVDGTNFSLPRNHKMCKFGKWFYSFKTSDEGLRTLLDRTEEPHIHIHSLADKLLTMKLDGKRDEAIQILKNERDTTLKRLLRTLDFIIDFLQVGIHPVVLHLTQDGQSPWFSLVLDEIHDIMYYDPNRMDRGITRDSERDPVCGYIRNQGDVNFLMLSVDQLHQNLTEKFRQVA